MNRVNYGATVNDRTGDPLREAFRKFDDNFKWLKGGTLANRPAANTVTAGTIYVVEDSTPPNAVFRSDGTTWTVLDAVPEIRCVLSNSVSQSIANATLTTAVFDTEDADSDGMGDVANNRIVVQTAGVYLLGAVLRWDENGSGRRVANVVLNATNVAFDDRFPSSASSRSNSTFSSPPLRLAVNDAVTLTLYQDSGAARTLPGATTKLWAVRIAP
jgi:hypothetical protein